MCAQFNVNKKLLSIILSFMRHHKVYYCYKAFFPPSQKQTNKQTAMIFENRAIFHTIIFAKEKNILLGAPRRMSLFNNWHLLLNPNGALSPQLLKAQHFYATAKSDSFLNFFFD